MNKFLTITTLSLSPFWLIYLISMVSWQVNAFFDEDNRSGCIGQNNMESCRQLIIDNKVWKLQMEELIKQIEWENIDANKIIENEVNKTLSGTDFKLSFQ